MKKEKKRKIKKKIPKKRNKQINKNHAPMMEEENARSKGKNGSSG
jgi:hypothetical protein